MTNLIKENFEDIILECAKRNIPIRVEYCKEKKVLHYNIDGFSKSGHASIYYVGGAIFCKARYNQITQINSFSDLSDVAFDWYITYKDRNPFESPSQYWVEDWVKRGLMEKKLVTEYVVK